MNQRETTAMKTAFLTLLSGLVAGVLWPSSSEARAAGPVPLQNASFEDGQDAAGVPKHWQGDMKHLSLVQTDAADGLKAVRITAGGSLSQIVAAAEAPDYTLTVRAQTTLFEEAAAERYRSEAYLDLIFLPSDKRFRTEMASPFGQSRRMVEHALGGTAPAGTKSVQVTISTVTVRIHHTADPGASSICYDGVYVNGLEQCRTGLWCDRLPAGSVVLMGHVIGNIRLTDCGLATILCAQHYYSLTLEGATQPKTGIAGFMFHNDACHNYALDVLDNQDVIVADFYSESNKRYLLATGEPGQTAGRVTIGASKISTVDREAVTIRNYEGRIFVGGGDGWWQSDTSQPLELVHEGGRPVDFVIAGQMWWRTEPIRKFGPGLRYASVENLLMENKYPEYNQKSLPNVSTPTTQAALSGAFDDFRELGTQYLHHYFTAGAKSAP
jgi:hypothetical protein